jgi:hypothetical protein
MEISTEVPQKKKKEENTTTILSICSTPGYIIKVIKILR